MAFGRVPVRFVLRKLQKLTLDQASKPSGSVPLIVLLPNERITRLDQRVMEAGIVPVKKLLFTWE